MTISQLINLFCWRIILSVKANMGFCFTFSSMPALSNSLHFDQHETFVRRHDSITQTHVFDKSIWQAAQNDCGIRIQCVVGLRQEVWPWERKHGRQWHHHHHHLECFDFQTVIERWYYYWTFKIGFVLNHWVLNFHC